MEKLREEFRKELLLAFDQNPANALQCLREEIKADIALFLDWQRAGQRSQYEREEIQAVLLDAEADAYAAMHSQQRHREGMKAGGFSLIELLVVVAIILIIAAIAIPKLMSARATSVETAAAASMRSFSTALAGYQSKYGNFPATFTVLGGDCSATPPTPALACQLDDTIAQAAATGPYQSYVWTYTPSTGGGSFQMNADPAPGVSSLITRHLWSSDGFVIHRNDVAPATAADPTL